MMNLKRSLSYALRTAFGRLASLKRELEEGPEDDPSPLHLEALQGDTTRSPESKDCLPLKVSRVKGFLVFPAATRHCDTLRA